MYDVLQVILSVEIVLKFYERSVEYGGFVTECYKLCFLCNFRVVTVTPLHYVKNSCISYSLMLFSLRRKLQIGQISKGFH